MLWRSHACSTAIACRAIRAGIACAAECSARLRLLLRAVRRLCCRTTVLIVCRGPVRRRIPRRRPIRSIPSRGTCGRRRRVWAPPAFLSISPIHVCSAVLISPLRGAWCGTAWTEIIPAGVYSATRTSLRIAAASISLIRSLTFPIVVPPSAGITGFGSRVVVGRPGIPRCISQPSGLRRRASLSIPVVTVAIIRAIVFHSRI